MHLRAALLAVVVTGLVVAGCGGSSHDDTAAPPARAALVPVPRLVGVEAQAAHRRAASAGMVMRWGAFVGRAANGRYELPCVKVHTQAPVAGERRPKGTVIQVTEEGCSVPKGVAKDFRDGPSTSPNKSGG